MNNLSPALESCLSHLENGTKVHKFDLGEGRLRLVNFSVGRVEFMLTWSHIPWIGFMYRVDNTITEFYYYYIDERTAALLAKHKLLDYTDAMYYTQEFIPKCKYNLSDEIF